VEVRGGGEETGQKKRGTGRGSGEILVFLGFPGEKFRRERRKRRKVKMERESGGGKICTYMACGGEPIVAVRREMWLRKKVWGGKRKT